MRNYNTLEEIENILVPRGFHKYNPTPYDNESVCCNFQKRYDDEIGKKYFIDVKIWDWTRFDRIPEKYSMEFNGQYYQKGTHNAVNFTFIDWTLDEVEKWIEDLFQVGFIEHYEEWD